MRKLMFAVLCAVMILGTVMAAHAEPGDWHGGIRARIHHARERIDRGIDQGSITRHEARLLNERLEHILNKIDRMRADGHLDPRERDRINYDLDKLEREISRFKHDYDGPRGGHDRGDYDRRRY